MITVGKIDIETFMKVMRYAVIFLFIFDGLLVIFIHDLYREVTQLYVKIELMRRGHIDHTEDDIDTFIQEYKEGMKNGIHNE